MAKKRGLSGLSLVVGVDKPLGMSSHDVVNKCRRIFGERRIGHTGTLDPAASGALLVCVGPAARLDSYLSSDEKIYRVRIAFGVSTDTDDAQGSVADRCSVPNDVMDADYAQAVLQGFLGQQMQLPPVYSALKVNGKKACDEARKGNVIDLQPRSVNVKEGRLLAIYDGFGQKVFQDGPADEKLENWEQEGVEPTYAGQPQWEILFHVSKGTYIRSLARDIGLRVGCGAHVCALRRVSAGYLSLDDCVSLETLEDIKTSAALDPVPLLGFRFAFLDEQSWLKVKNGNPLPASSVTLCQRRFRSAEYSLCACTSGVCESCDPVQEGEIVSLLYDNKIVALYAYQPEKDSFACRCMFTEGIARGFDL